MPVNGPALAVTAAGGLFLWSALKGKSVLSSLQTIVRGTSPAAAAAASQIPGTTPGATGVPAGTLPSSGSAQGDLQQAAAARGWGTGAQWQALQNVEMKEAGYDPTAQNASGAYGMAQSLGHPFTGGPAPNGVNEYGGYGLTPAQSRAASMGDPAPQAQWMVAYIADRYGSPEAAWQHEQQYGWY